MININLEFYIGLKKKIIAHNTNYYDNDSPVISDEEYDLLFEQLKHIEKEYPEWVTKDSPTQNVGGNVKSGFNSVKHLSKMLSIDNANNAKEFKDFDKRVNKTVNIKAYVLQLKYDGVSASLLYEKGRLVRALTRGNGFTGEDVTNNVKTIKNVPLSLKGNNIPDVVEIRGEVMILKKDFKELNESLIKSGESPFANSRNASSGALRQLDVSVTASRPLVFYSWGLGDYKGIVINDECEKNKLIEEWGFDVGAGTTLYHNLDEIVEKHREYSEKRESLDYDIDGVVLKVNDISQQEQLGVTSRHPRWCVAYKFKSAQATTILKGITLQMGRTGILTPVAELEPVSLVGTTISKATLHNANFIKEKDIRIGDKVTIKRAGDVIPAIVSSIRTEDSKKSFTFPDDCPFCKEFINEYTCVNDLCTEKSVQRMKYIVSRAVLNIKGVGEKIIRKSNVYTLKDLYYLNENKLEKAGYKEKTIKNILEAIRLSKDVDFDILLQALLIPGVGKKVSGIISDNISSIKELSSLGSDRLEKIKGISKETARNTEKFNFSKEVDFLVNMFNIKYKDKK